MQLIEYSPGIWHLGISNILKIQLGNEMENQLSGSVLLFYVYVQPKVFTWGGWLPSHPMCLKQNKDNVG